MPSRTRLQESGTTGSFNARYREYLLSPEWDALRRQALKRAGYRCSICNRSVELECHHRTYENVQLNDLLPVCRDHHQMIYEDERRRKKSQGTVGAG